MKTLLAASTLFLLIIFQLNIELNGITTDDESQNESRNTYGNYQPVNEKTFDLSYPYDNSTTHWPTSMGFTFVKQIVQRENETTTWYAANDFCVGEHGGTHLDAPYHFNRHGWKVADIPIVKLINRAFVLDVETYNDNQASTKDTSLEPRHIQEFEKKLFGRNGTLPENSILLIRFNWGQYYGTGKYFNHIPRDDVHGDELFFPGIGAEAARLLVSRKIAGVGVDTASVDLGSSDTYDSHKIFAKANIFSMENVNIPKELVEFNDNLVVYALPMNILEGTGAPVRVVAVVPKKIQTEVVAKIEGRSETQKREASSRRLVEVNKAVPVNSGVAWYAHVWVILCTLILLGMHADVLLSK